MSLTHVGKNGRIYQRKFDHGQAKRRYEAGESVAEMAREYGVSENAVYRVVSPGTRAAYDRFYASLKGKGRCDRCGEPMNQGSRYAGSRQCQKCCDDDRATSVRPGVLLCFGCREWRPDEEFPRNRSTTVRRRGRHASCRACSTAQRRDYRQRNREASNAYDREYKRKRRAEGKK